MATKAKKYFLVGGPDGEWYRTDPIEAESGLAAAEILRAEWGTNEEGAEFFTYELADRNFRRFQAKIGLVEQ